MAICMMLHDASHPNRTFGVWDSGLVRRVGLREEEHYAGKGVPNYQVRSQDEYGLLVWLANQMDGGHTVP